MDTRSRNAQIWPIQPLAIILKAVAIKDFVVFFFTIETIAILFTSLLP